MSRISRRRTSVPLAAAAGLAAVASCVVALGQGSYGLLSEHHVAGARGSTSRMVLATGALAGRGVSSTDAGQAGIGGSASRAAGGPTPAVASRGPGTWQPQPARYGIGTTLNVPVQMKDGTTLRVDVFYPTEPQTGLPAPGRFPVVLVQTPYGKGTAPAYPYLVQRGFLNVVADVRGTGDSGGTFGFLAPVEAQDGATLVNWCAHLPDSSGKVGLAGGSYLGLNQFMTGAAVGPHSPLKAIFPIIAGNSLYRDAAFMGGLVDEEFSSVELGLTAALNTVEPVAEEGPTGFGSVLGIEEAHAGALFSFDARSLSSALTGGSRYYDGAWWRLRAPRHMLPALVRNGIPAFLVSGWSDLFQRGDPINYAELQNLVDGRPYWEPMQPGQPVTGRYQLMMGPWYHLTAGDGVDLNRIMLEWFDTWLLGEPTGMGTTPTPLHVYVQGEDRWFNSSTWPLTGTHVERAYFGGRSAATPGSLNSGSLSSVAPSTTSGADAIAWTGASSPCSNSTDQWDGGLYEEASASSGLPSNPCTSNDATTQATALTYTSAPMPRAELLAGPIDVTLYATSTTPNTEFVARVEEVTPSGQSIPLTEGGLLGSFRAQNQRDSWRSPTGKIELPYHLDTSTSQEPVPVGKVVRYNIDVFPTVAELPAGSSLRVTITTADTPHLAVAPPFLAQLAGGVYMVQRRDAAASFVDLPLAPLDLLSLPCGLCQASSGGTGS